MRARQQITCAAVWYARAMKRARLGLLLVGLFLSLASAVQQPAQQQPQGGPGMAGGAGGGTCQGACAHYLQCKGVNDAQTYQSCVAECQQGAVQPQTLAMYEATDCAQAISIVEGGGGMQGGGGGSAGGPQPGSKECENCRKWDDQCAVVVETAVGSGPYSGGVIDCAPSCCGN